MGLGKVSFVKMLNSCELNYFLKDTYRYQHD